MAIVTLKQTRDLLQIAAIRHGDSSERMQVSSLPGGLLIIRPVKWHFRNQGLETTSSYIQPPSLSHGQ